MVVGGKEETIKWEIGMDRIHSTVYKIDNH